MSEFAGGGGLKKHESTTNKTCLGGGKHESIAKNTGSVNFSGNFGVLELLLGYFNPVPHVFYPCP
jgi:hypothetical protein